MTDAIAGTFPQVRQRQPHVTEHSRSQPDAPTRASPLPAHPRVRRRAGNSAQYPPHQKSRQSSRKRHREDGARRTGNCFCSPPALQHGAGHEQWWSLTAGVNASSASTSRQLPKARADKRVSQEPPAEVLGLHPGSHPAAQHRLEGFARFPHSAGSFARKSKFINSAFQHEQMKVAELDSQISLGLSTGPSPASSPTRKDGPFPPLPSWPGPSSLSRKPASGGVCVRCAAWEHPCRSWSDSQSKAAELASKRPEAVGMATCSAQGRGRTQFTAAGCPARAKGHKSQGIA